jgi:HK97 gp10 family phage protein
VGADMRVNFRNKVEQLGRKGKVLEGQVLKSAGEVLANSIAGNINRSRGGEGYKHLSDNITVSNVRSNAFGERSVQVGAIKELGYRLKFLEFGTSKMSPQAPMEKGVSTSKDDVAAILTQGMRKVMKL